MSTTEKGTASRGGIDAEDVAVGIQIAFDCADVDAQASFWAAALGYQLQPPPPGFESWDAFLDSVGIAGDERHDVSAVVDPAGAGPRLFFHRVPEPKSAKNRVHLDLSVAGGRSVEPALRARRVDAAVDRLVGLGATKVQVFVEPDERYVVMRDPEGNEFCLQ